MTLGHSRAGENAMLARFMKDRTKLQQSKKKAPAGAKEKR